MSNSDWIELRGDCIGSIASCHAVWLDPILDPPGLHAPLPQPPASAPPLAVAPFSAEEARQHQENWAKYLGRQVDEMNSIDMKLVLIPPGEFMMGSPDSEPLHEGDEPQHRVRITKPFYLGTYEVTQEEYERDRQEPFGLAEPQRSQGAGP